MHPRVLAERTTSAHENLAAAAADLSQRLGIDPPALPEARDTAVREMMQIEALAEWLERVAGELQPPALPALADLEAIQGVGAATAKRILLLLEGHHVEN